MQKDTIFLCHANEDKPRVSIFYQRLKKDGLNPWLDKENLLPGQHWREVIAKTIKKSSFIIIFLSKTAVSKRGYVQKEFKLALDVLAEIPEDQIFIIPVRLEDCEIPEQFKDIHFVDLFDEGGYNRVIKAIQTKIVHIGKQKLNEGNKKGTSQKPTKSNVKFKVPKSLPGTALWRRGKEGWFLMVDGEDLSVGDRAEGSIDGDDHIVYDKKTKIYYLCKDYYKQEKSNDNPLSSADIIETPNMTLWRRGKEGWFLLVDGENLSVGDRAEGSKDGDDHIVYDKKTKIYYLCKDYYKQRRGANNELSPATQIVVK